MTISIYNWPKEFEKLMWYLRIKYFQIQLQLNQVHFYWHFKSLVTIIFLGRNHTLGQVKCHDLLHWKKEKLYCRLILANLTPYMLNFYNIFWYFVYRAKIQGLPVFQFKMYLLRSTKFIWIVLWITELQHSLILSLYLKLS